ncbi:MAG: hypothetical protein AcusKO_39830 [Acuticoccus sp.]
MSDESGASVAKDIVVALADVAETPLATDDTAALDAYDDVLTLTVLGNDTDPDTGADLTITEIDDSGTVGSVSIADADGQFRPLPIRATPSRSSARVTRRSTPSATPSRTKTGLSDTATVTLTIHRRTGDRHHLGLRRAPPSPRAPGPTTAT